MSGKRMGNWDDDTIKGGGYNERPDVYKAKQGYTDIIRFITAPVSLLLVNVNPKGGKGFSTPTLADYDDVMEGFIDGNDKEAQKRAKEKCPALQRGYGVKRRFVALVWHAYRVNRKGQRKKVMQAIPMIFDGGKYEMIHAIKKSLPPIKGKRRPLHLAEIQITCTDSQFQKMNFSMNPTPSQKWAEVRAEVEDLFENGFDPTEEVELVEAVTEAESFQSLRESLDRVEGKGNFEDDDDDSDEWEEETEDDEEEEERPRRRKKKAPAKKKRPTKKKSRRKAKPKPEPEEDDDEDVDDDDELADELDEALDDEDLDDYDEDDDEDED